MNEFYSSEAWRKLRRQAVTKAGFRCQNCGASVHAKGSSRVDHIIPIKIAPHRALDPTNLRVLCSACDNARHSEKGKGGEQKARIGADGFPDSWR